MTRAVVAALAALAVAAVAVASSAQARPTALGRVQVVEKEFTLTLSRLSVHPGRVIIQVVNFGQDPHDLMMLRNAKGAKAYHVGVVQPGSQGELDARLVPGRYQLWCSLPGHRASGMHATLTVR